MMTQIIASGTTTSSFVKVGMIVAAFAVAAVPALTHAATFAYVNTAGNVSVVEAVDANTAIRTAPGISLHSGVLLLDSASDSSVVGDNVGGV